MKATSKILPKGTHAIIIYYGDKTRIDANRGKGQNSIIWDVKYYDTQYNKMQHSEWMTTRQLFSLINKMATPSITARVTFIYKTPARKDGIKYYTINGRA